MLFVQNYRLVFGKNKISQNSFINDETTLIFPNDIEIIYKNITKTNGKLE